MCHKWITIDYQRKFSMESWSLVSVHLISRKRVIKTACNITYSTDFMETKRTLTMRHIKGKKDRVRQQTT